MANEYTQLADMAVVPELFEQYLVSPIYDKMALMKSGAVYTNDTIKRLLLEGGSEINMPSFNPLSGASVAIQDGTIVETGKVTSKVVKASPLYRAKGFAASDFASFVADGDAGRVLEVILDGIAAYWAKEIETAIYSVLKGLFASTKGADFAFDADGAGDVTLGTGEVMSGDVILSAQELRGDALDNQKIILVNSKVYTQLNKAGLVVEGTAMSDERDIINKEKINTVYGMRVLVDDVLPSVTAGSGVMNTTYIFGDRAISAAIQGMTRLNGKSIKPIGIERDEAVEAGQDNVYSRMVYVVSPNGWSFSRSALAGETPTNTELEAGAQWTMPTGMDDRANKIYRVRTN